LTDLFSVLLHFELFEGAPSQALQIIFEMQNQRSSQKKEHFLTSSTFLPIFSAIDAQRRGGLHLLFGNHKQWALLQKW
jgi:hypothetical protein